MWWTTLSTPVFPSRRRDMEDQRYPIRNPWMRIPSGPAGMREKRDGCRDAMHGIEILLRVSQWGYRVAQSFVFAIEEINRSAHLLPNLTLGFSIRNSGDSVHGAVHETMSFLTGKEEPIPNYTCQHGTPLAALVGDTRSSLSVSMARLLGLYRFPQVPTSVCSESCLPGFSQVPRLGAPQCCFDCSLCPEGQFADKKDMKRCLPCPKEQYSSHSRDRCLPRTELFLAFEEPLGFMLALVALFLAGLAVLVLGVFLKHRDTPVVRANNRTLSYVLLMSLSLCALCALLFLGRPTVTTCLLRQTTFAVVFTVAISSVLAKTLTVVLAFRATKPGGRIQVCLSPGASTSVVVIASAMQVLLCGLWLATSPPFPDRDMASEPQHTVIRCQEGSGTAFLCVLGYLGLLAGATFSVAFLARDLPDVFNETKFLTFSMLLFCSVWTTFLPLYHSARGKSTVAVEIFSILASTAGLLGGIFIPKCYIILLKPERNTPAWLRQSRQAQQDRQSEILQTRCLPRATPHNFVM